MSTDDGGVTISDSHCYRLALTLTDRDGSSATYTSPPVTIEKPAPTATLTCSPDSMPTSADTIVCSATFSEAPAAGSSFGQDDIAIGGKRQAGWRMGP